ncbi:MAG: hypothetical protein IKY42_01095 [Bacteroidaceae bacterium]|nr:hypothetical protein [Bacteroidaceae bacterium]
MKSKTILTICLLGMFAPCSRAHYSSCENIPTLIMEEEEKLPLKIKEININTGGEPDRRTLIPEVTLQGNTLCFITPCNGCTFRLVQGNNICYNVEITGNTLAIPTTFSGMYELQIVSGDIIFYTEVEL